VTPVLRFRLLRVLHFIFRIDDDVVGVVGPHGPFFDIGVTAPSPGTVILFYLGCNEWKEANLFKDVLLYQTQSYKRSLVWGPLVTLDILAYNIAILR